MLSCSLISHRGFPPCMTSTPVYGFLVYYFVSAVHMYRFVDISKSLGNIISRIDGNEHIQTFILILNYCVHICYVSVCRMPPFMIIPS